ncbi:hypothetical protein GCM10023090_16280 [Acidovorax lacteus]|uniref:Sel1 repeat family protein n=2 Tax=Acidovorax lacteus TaxID=1924988 RepID=A0ABP8L8F4_9BURK
MALLGLAMVSSGWAYASFEEGMGAMGTRDFARARAFFEAAPADARAVYQLSRLARLGLGEAVDATRAAQLLARASELGHLDAQLDYVYALANGQGVAKDVPGAMQRLQALSDKGVVEAQIELGRALYFGFWGQPREVQRSLVWLEKAARTGNAEAKTLLGIALLDGDGAPIDEARGVALVREGAEGGRADAMNRYAAMLTFGRVVPRDEAAGARWYRQSADKLDPTGQYGTALAYLNGRGVPKDEALGIRYLDAAARQGWAWAQMDLAERYFWGQGVPQMRGEAYYWYSVAATSRTASVQERAGVRRAEVARELNAAEVERTAKRAAAFRVQPGFAPRAEALPVLSAGDRVSIGGVALTIPAPKGFTNGWELANHLQRAFPNNPGFRPLLMALMRQDDMDRIKLGIASDLRTIEVSRHVPDDAMAVDTRLFADIKRQLRSQIDANIANGQFRSEGLVRDDERVFAMMRSSVVEPQRFDAVALVLLKDRVLSVSFAGFTPEHKAEVESLVQAFCNGLLSANRAGLFTQ